MHEPLRIAGAEIAERMLARLAEAPDLTTRYLAGFVAAHDPAGQSYQRRKQRAAVSAGISYRITLLPDGITQEDAAELVAATAADPDCGGIVIQLPLPETLDAQALLDLVPAHKDPDVLSTAAYAAFAQGTGPVLPPAARVTELVAEAAGFTFAGRTVAVLGKGRLIGRPAAAWLRGRAGRVLELDRGFDETLLAMADLVICGTGAYELHPQRLKDGAGVIDFGYRQDASSPTGDLVTADPDALQRLAFYTPTPGGTGPILIAALLENFVRLNETA